MMRPILCALGVISVVFSQIPHRQESPRAESGRPGSPAPRPELARRPALARSPSWSVQISGTTRQSAYHFQSKGDGTFVSPSWIRDVGARVDGSGIRLGSRRPWEKGLSLELR